MVVVREISSDYTGVSWISGMIAVLVKATWEVATWTLDAGADVSVVTCEGACTSTLEVGGNSGEISILWSGPAVAVEVPGCGEDSRMGMASGAPSGSTNMEEFSPRCTSKTGMAILQSPEDGSSSETVSMVVDRYQITASREWRPLLLKLGGLESDHAGILGSWLILLQSRELGMGVTLLAVSSVALCPYGEVGLEVALGGVVGLPWQVLDWLAFLHFGCRLGRLLSLGAG